MQLVQSAVSELKKVIFSTNIIHAKDVGERIAI